MEITVNNIRIRTALPEEYEELDMLFAGQYLSQPELVPGRDNPPSKWAAGSDLPKEGKAENYELLTLSMGDIAVGYAAVYRFYPNKELVFLRRFFISSSCVDEDVRKTVISELKNYFFEVGYHSMRGRISYRDPQSIELWFSLGFDRMVSLNEANGTAVVECRLHG